jgi:hypothetical protein
MKDCQIVKSARQIKERGEDGYLQATLVRSCRAKFWIWLLGNGTNPLPLRKSKTLCPSKSVTMQIWFRKSKQSRKWMHLLRLVLSFDARVDKTRSSILEASLYFWTDRMILTAQRVFFFLSKASTTLPKVPCPSSFTTESGKRQISMEIDRWLLNGRDTHIALSSLPLG